MIKLGKEIWHYLLNHSMSITVEYLPSVLHTVADRESRKKKTDFSEWFLQPKVLQAVSWLLGSLTVDLFASSLYHQLPQLIVWHPDTYSQGTDAMIQNWNIGLPYTISPFSMISRVLLNIKQECDPLLILIASLEYQGISLGKRNSYKPQKYCPPIDGWERIDTGWFQENPFVWRNFRKHFLHHYKSQTKRHSLIISQPKETDLTGVLNEKLILFRHL